MSMVPRSGVAERRQQLVRRLGMVASGLMVVLVVAVLGFVVRSERAHDEGTCPFRKLGERRLGEALVIEEGRRCVPEAEEHRWLIERAGAQRVELGRKRLPWERFAAGRTAWTLRLDPAHKLLLNIEVDGQPLSEFREADL